MNIRAAPIAVRSFVLALAALVLAQAIGLALMLMRPPIRNAPLPLSVAARLLEAGPGDTANANATSPRPAPGPGPGPRPGPDESPGAPRNEVRVSTVTGPPRAAPPDQDAAAADQVRRALAAMTGIATDTLSVHVRRGNVLAPPPEGEVATLMLGEGFYLARALPDGRWRVVESVVEPFPNAFHRQVLWLLALGALLLLPLAWLFARAIARPIQRFAAAAQRVGVDPQTPPLPLQGPAEIRHAAESFNLMQSRVLRLLEERNEMIAAIAHDLRTPLARLSFRLAELPEPAQRRAAADIDEMTTMIARTLDFCRGRAQSQQRDPIDFRLLVESVVDDYADIGAPVALTASDAAVVRGDAVALRRAIGNLVDNALKYGQRARLGIASDAEHVRLLVDDDGPGIPAQDQARALRPFTRLEGSRGRETGGTGLGLTVVRATVLDHGGVMSLENRAEGGLRVQVQLPRAEGYASP
ncbi:MAG: HAMP domain-containing protein [Proteobacteria bacterium]|nr:HAMP domain-containing protein [Pseudomonadota bacterium]